MPKKTVPYADWQPAISAEEVFADVVGFSEIKIVKNSIYWLELRPSEQGRYVVVMMDEKGNIKDITPKEYNARTRVHEYGGGSYTVNQEFVFFTNFQDQRIYKQKADGSSKPLPITPAKNKDDSLGKYAHFQITSDKKFLLFVYEKEFTNKENENFIAMLDLAKGEQEPTILVKGNDFYADPELSPDGTKLAWLSWNHPHMPWDSSELWIADFESGKIKNQKKVAGSFLYAICLPKFDQNSALYFVMDKSGEEENSPKNWWNLYRYQNNNVEPVTQELAEFGTPHWVFGSSEYLFQDNTMLAVSRKNGKDTLNLIDTKTKTVKPLSLPIDDVAYLDLLDSESLVFVAGAPTAARSSAVRSVMKVNLKTLKTEIIKKSTNTTMKPEDASAPEHIVFPTRDKSHAFAFYYKPKNARYEAPANDKPALLVMVHGGPTSCTRGTFSLSKQFWTSQGFAILDIDYRGSTGYGRKYRDDLKAKWGVIDANDYADAVKYAIKQGWCDPKKICITGGSAGGYAVQRALTMFPDLFTTGASYFGIGNLLTFDVITHKFESKYDEWLIGKPLKGNEALYKERSPIFFLDNLKSPMILFQGSDDKIVPPECSREVAEALKKKGVYYEYYEYEGEAHGFRMKKNNIDSLNKESAFYRKVFNL